jgi:hypothetical protein
MRYTSIRNAGGPGVEIVGGKTGRSPKRQTLLPDDEHDAEQPEEHAPPPPGMGKLVDKTV